MHGIPRLLVWLDRWRADRRGDRLCDWLQPRQSSDSRGSAVARDQGLILRKDRRIILLCACVICLFIGFMAGMILFYPREHVEVSVQVAESQSEVKSEQISL